MLKFVIALILALLLQSAVVVSPVSGSANAINLVLSPSRQSGVAPLGVVFSAVGTSSATSAASCTSSYTDIEKGFHCIQYIWSFGDSASGTWKYGAPGLTSRNLATGPVAAHVFEWPAGNADATVTRTVTLEAYDGTTTSTGSVTLTLRNPDLVYAGSATKCYYQTSPSGDCPAGGSETRQSDFAAAMAACISSRTRCLFQRGSVFTQSKAANIGRVSGATVGSYSNGPAPEIRQSADVYGVHFTARGNPSDIRIMDLKFVGIGAAASSGEGVHFSTDSENVTLLRLVISDTGSGLGIVSNAGVGATGFVGTGLVVADSFIHDLRRGNAFFGRLTKSAFIGNSGGPSGAHNWRIQKAQEFAFTNNRAIGPAAGKHNLTVRANEHLTGSDQDTKWVYISDNLFDSDDNEMVNVEPSSDTQNHWIDNVIFERNWLRFGTRTQYGFSIQDASKVTVRFNIFDMTRSTVGRNAISTRHGNIAGAPTPDRNSIYNNTCFSGAGASVARCVVLGGAGNASTNTTVRNNLSWMASSAGAVFMLQQGAAGTVPACTTACASNSSDAQTRSTDPRFLDASRFTPANAAPRPDSYAASGGVDMPAWRDFFLQPIGSRFLGAVRPGP